MSEDNSTTILSTYVFEKQAIRIHIDGQGQVWFVAADVCDALGIQNASDTLTHLRPQEKGIAIFSTPGGQQEMLTVSEPGLYRLLFRSNKPAATAFQDWVYNPAVRPERAEISEQLTAVWMCFKRQDTPTWIDSRELAMLSGVTYNTARQLTTVLFRLGLLELEERHPRHLYRLAEKAAKRNPGMYQRLDLHAEIIKARKGRQLQRWDMDEL
jgi:prophage antirepressor-like protein